MEAPVRKEEVGVEYWPRDPVLIQSGALRPFHVASLATVGMWVWSSAKRVIQINIGFLEDVGEIHEDGFLWIKSH